MNITMTRDEIKTLLNINNDRMKYLTKKDKLKEELVMVGYDLINSYKDGRNTLYELVPTEVDEWLQYQNYRNIRKKDEHTTYVENRITNGMKKSRSSFVKELDMDISESSARRYDKMLLEDEVMQKTGEVYVLYNPNNATFKEITKQEYNDFWCDLGELKRQLSINKHRYTTNEITERVYDNNKLIFMSALGKEKGEIALKYDTYSEYTNTIKVLKMIRKHKNRG